jgi:hypothetical protein
MSLTAFAVRRPGKSIMLALFRTYRTSAAISVLIAATAAGQVVPAIHLRAPDARLDEELTDIARTRSAIRELADGRVILVESGSHSRLLVVDFAKNVAEVIGRRGAGPGEYDVVVGAVALPADSTLVLTGSGRWLFLVGGRIAGTVSRSEQVARTGTVCGGISRSGMVLVCPSAGFTEDSTERFLVNRATGKSEPVAHLALGHEPGFPPQPAARGGTVTYPRAPWKSYEDAIMFEDGWIAVVRFQPYRVDWRHPDGRWLRGSALPVPVVPVTVSEKKAYMDRWSEETGRARQQPEMFEPWPKTVPPTKYLSPLIAAPDGRVLIPRAETVRQPLPSYDVVSRQGKLEAKVVLGPRERLLGFGRRHVYSVATDADGIQRIRRHPWP